MKVGQKFKDKDKVKMFNCYEATFEHNLNKEFICNGNSFISKSGEEVVFLHGISGYFVCKYLKPLERIPVLDTIDGSY